MRLSSLSTYRNLLREVNRQFSKSNNVFVQQLRSIYRENKNVTDPDRIEALNRNAENVLVYLRSSRQHKELRERYAAVVMEQKKKVELTAKRVGLELPKEYKPDAHDVPTSRVLNAFQKQ